MYGFANEMYFVVNATGNKSTRDCTILKLLESSSIMASGISTILLPSDSNELRDRLKLLLQDKRAGNNSDIINDEKVANVDKLLEYKSISKKEDKQSLIKCNLLHPKNSQYNYSYGWYTRMRRFTQTNVCIYKYNTHIIVCINNCIHSFKYKHTIVFEKLYVNMFF